MEINLKDIKTYKSGTDYIVLVLPKRLLKDLPEGYFYTDLTIHKTRGGKPPK